MNTKPDILRCTVKLFDTFREMGSAKNTNEPLRHKLSPHYKLTQHQLV